VIIGFQKFTAMAMLLIAACAPSTEQLPDVEPPLLALDLPPASFGGSMHFSQLVTGEFGGRTETARFETEITGDHIVMAAFSVLGVPLFVLEEDADGIRLEDMTGGTLPFDPRYILADFKVVNWPLRSLAPALAMVGLHLDNVSGPSVRRISSGGSPVIIVQVGPDQITTVEHFDPPYRLLIETYQDTGAF
jgi:hypothetical protein